MRDYSINNFPDWDKVEDYESDEHEVILLDAKGRRLAKYNIPQFTQADFEKLKNKTKNLHLVKENDVYKREREHQFSNEEIITFKIPKDQVYKKAGYDWYMTVALEKSDKVTVDRHLLSADLLTGYRNAIREGFNHMLDPHLRSEYDHPRNRNTIKGIKNYIQKMLDEKQD